jgi:CubicO group peptidase (beta-lactamase class C family)
MRYLAAGALASCLTLATAAQSPPTPDRAASAVDAVVRRAMEAKRIPGAAVAVVQNGTPTLRRAYGVANLETDTPMTAGAIFEIASLTKQFTAAAIMLLVEEGKLGLDDPLSTYVGPVPSSWQRITIRHLLTHTSGLDISALPRVDGIAPLRVTRKHAFEFIAQQPMFTSTGRAGWYSDGGYVLLGLVVERVSGRTYREFIAERVFAPLKMADSSLLDKARVLKRRVSTYAVRGGEIVNWRRDWDYDVPSAFGIHSTLDDLAAWDASLRKATLLKRGTLDQIWTPAVLDNGRPARVYGYPYGFGWELADVRGRRTVGHGGASGTYMLRFVDEPLTIVVLTNLETEDRHPRALARAIAGAVRPEYQPPEALPPQPDPDPESSRTVQLLLGDLAARRVSAAMSDGYAAWYKDSPGAQALLARQLTGASAVTYLADDDLAGRSLWGSEPLWRIRHVAVDAGGRRYVVSAGLTERRTVATLDVQPR